MKLFTKTFGCQMNFADSDEMGLAFARRGFQKTDDAETADAVLVNTCTVRELAEHKAMSFVGRLREWKALRPERMIFVTGCAAERAKTDIERRFNHVDLVVGAKDIESFPRKLEEFLDLRKGEKAADTGRDPHAALEEEALIPAALAPGFPTDVVQYVTTMRGCNYSCTYCIVPSVRGREIYLPVEQIVTEVGARVAAGAKEIWLLGQTVNSYRPADRPGYEFGDLLRDVAAVPGLQRLRFISPHPYHLNDKLISAMAELPQVCEQMHLPVQSGSNGMLKRMRRTYTRELYLAGVEKLRRAIPDISITTDIIAGFPGETQEDHDATLDLIRQADFDSAYCFKYSPRPGTVSAEYLDDIPTEVKEARVNELLALTDAQGTRKANGLIGTVQEVLLEEDKGNGILRGKTRQGSRLRLSGEGLFVGQMVQARVTATHSRELHGELI